jgi:hypothetical protein
LILLGYLAGGVLAGFFLVMGGVTMPHPVSETINEGGTRCRPDFLYSSTILSRFSR